jgi:hypothetical protein
MCSSSSFKTYTYVWSSTAAADNLSSIARMLATSFDDPPRRQDFRSPRRSRFILRSSGLRRRIVSFFSHPYTSQHTAICMIHWWPLLLFPIPGSQEPHPPCRVAPHTQHFSNLVHDLIARFQPIFYTRNPKIEEKATIQ